MDIFADTSGGPNVLKVRGPAIAAALHGKETTPVTFDIDLIRKDLRTMLDEAKALGVTLPVSVLRTRVLRRHRPRRFWCERRDDAPGALVAAR